MKKLSTYLFLILFSFSAPSYADDIRDFQIEGVSIGDSLLDYFSEEKINANSRQDFYSEGKFVNVVIDHSQYFQVYDGVTFVHKKEDKGYKIYSITGYIDYDKNIDGCYKKLKELNYQLSEMFKDLLIEKWIEDSVKHAADKSGESTIRQIYYDFKSGEGVSIGCTDWSSKMNYPDSLQVNLDSKEFIQWWYPDGCGSVSMCYNRY